MGLMLMAAIAAGGVLGLMISTLAGGVGVALTVRNARIRLGVWRTFAVTSAIVLPLCVFAVHQHPYEPVSPGSDYDLAMKNLFLQGLGYCASPGTAALLAGMATWLAPRRSRDKEAS